MSFKYLCILLITTVAINVSAKQSTKVILDSTNQELAIVTTDEYGDKYVSISGLTEDLFQRYLVVKSRGPAWQGEAISLLENTYDFHESTSYWYERTEATDLTRECDWELTEEDAEDVFESGYAEYQLSNWQAVKAKSGGKTFLYIVDLVTLVHWNGNTCEIVDDQFVFENTPTAKTQPVFLGRLTK